MLAFVVVSTLNVHDPAKIRCPPALQLCLRIMCQPQLWLLCHVLLDYMFPPPPRRHLSLFQNRRRERKWRVLWEEDYLGYAIGPEEDLVGSR